LNAIRGHPLAATPVPDQTTGLRLLRQGSTDAVLVINPSAPADRLLVASAQGPGATSAAQALLTQAETTLRRQTTISDVVPAQAGDAHGMTGSYLVFGWIVGGYLVAAAMGIANGGKPKTTRQALIRLTLMAVYAAMSGLAGAIIVDAVFGAITGHLLALLETIASARAAGAQLGIDGLL
jgi:hypothetical protein